ncbi:MAG: ExeM/NucH family extracellular endonuclease, partial [Propionibacteriales bacterium]|nr:ExeM/NucH family extracellular endonuclease [Propionibacteriales bacterium]
APEDVGGGVLLATFNVLNYFTTTGEDAGCSSFYNDREGNPITVNRCGDTGPRGAANAENLERQQAKIVTAINATDADVVSLEEIENSAAFDKDRDTALSSLVDALNAGAGSEVWHFVPSPATVPADEDVIRTAFIYKSAAVETVGASQILVGNAAFDNARQPLAQAFRPVGTAGDETFVVVVNHFKSKGSGEGDDADQGDGQGSSNASRVRQAHALVEFADAFAADAGTEKVFLAGDFNSYTKEDPLAVLEDAGYVNVAQTKTDKETYQFGGMIGSLDHVFASAGAYGAVKGADIWNINAYESIAREYSRYNYNATNYYDESAFRSSDHDPIVVGFGDVKTEAQVTASQAPPMKVKADKTKARIRTEVTATGLTPSGKVTVYYEGEPVGEASLKKGSATIRLDRFTATGAKELSIVYHGTEAIHSALTTVTIQVVP